MSKRTEVKAGKLERMKTMLKNMLAERNRFDDNIRLTEAKTVPGSDRRSTGSGIAALYGPEPRFRRPA